MAPRLLARAAIDAADLFRQHPPRLLHPKKVRLFELAGGAARVPTGRVSVSRWLPLEGLEELRVGTPVALSGVSGAFAYGREEGRAVPWYVNFADTELFAFYGGPAFAQDEIQVAEHPILASVRTAMLAGALGEGLRATTRDGNLPSPVLVAGAERWSAIDTDPPLAEPYGIYGRRLGRASDEALAQAVTRLEGATSNIVAMVAPQGSGRYTRAQIEDVLLTAATAFAAVRAEAEGARVVVHTGHWGTGAFGGNRRLMAAAQIVAARASGLDALVYHSLDEDGEDAFRRGAALASEVPDGASLADVATKLDALGFGWGASDGN